MPSPIPTGKLTVRLIRVAADVTPLTAYRCRIGGRAPPVVLRVPPLSRDKTFGDRGLAMHLRKLGLIGGMSWASTALYYQHLNKDVARRMGGLHSAPLVIESLDFAGIAACQQAGDWDAAARILIASGHRLSAAGAEGILVASNTMHKVYDRLQAALDVPVLHIADVTAMRMRADGITRAGLLGTRFTMREAFFRDRLESHGISVAVPQDDIMREVDRIIFEELVHGQVSRVSQRVLKTQINAFAQGRNQAVILGCTELVLAVDVRANIIPVYDTTCLHAEAAVDWMMTQAEAARFAA